MLSSIPTDHEDAAKPQRAPAITPFTASGDSEAGSVEGGNVSDEELMEGILRRDQNALALLYDRYARLLFNLCLAVVKKQEDAEDLLQEAFLLIWEKAAAFSSSKGSAYAWIVTLTRNRAIDRLRSKDFRDRQLQHFDFDFEKFAGEGIHSPLETASLAERAQIVKEAFAKLSPAQGEVIRMAYFEGYTQSQIADRLGVPLGTVKTRIREGMKKLNRLLIKRL
jgi:RNA polymerase sigma-70 factor (ECF subfamily)